MLPSNSSPPAKRILIVDDDPSIRYMLGRVLLDEGYQTMSAASGRDGLKIVAAESVDLILLDLKMPGLDGCETLEELAALRPGLPVILMTAFPGQKARGIQLGFSALFQKPLDFPILLEAIRKLLARGAAPT